MVSRRQFLKTMALLSSALVVPGHLSLANERRLVNQPTVLQAYLDWMERPHQGALNELFNELIEDDIIAFMMYDITDQRLVAAVRPESLMPVASAFKCGVLLYFIHQVDAAVWGSVPVEYWNVGSKNDVPEEYQAAWEQHHDILRALHQMIVISDNNAVGSALAYVAQLRDSVDPLILFNDWSHDVVGISQLSSLSSWRNGVPSYMHATDQRFTGREVNFKYRLVAYENLMTVRDLGLYYAWMLSAMTPEQRATSEAVLSIINDDRRANIERVAFENQGIAYSKNGALPPSDSPFGTVITDAGIIEIPGGKSYLLAFLSADAENKVQPTFEFVDEVIRGQYDGEIEAYQLALANEADTAWFHEQHLTQAYQDVGLLQTEGYNYAFVKYEGIDIFYEPREDRPLRNPVISSTRFGVHLLMQGALVRYRLVDETWAELIPDNARDNVQDRLGAHIYMKNSDLHPIALTYSSPIDYLVESNITQNEKFVVIGLQERRLTLFEGERAVLKVPIILNPYSTPRGSYVITSKWFARSMQPWAPGVPFTSFFHQEGFALHGSPWQRWETTVNETNIMKRTSAGCINIPNWMVTVGSYTRPADELLFRWLGGLQEPEKNVYEYANRDYPATRIFVVDYLDDLKQYRLPDGAYNAKIAWGDVTAQIEQTVLAAPNTFFTSAQGTS